MSWRDKLLWAVIPERDYRHFFENFTTRKPVSWDAMKKYDFNTNDLPEYLEMLKELPVVDGESLVNPCDSNNVAYQEYVLERHNKYYYVNTEGFNYPRYMFEIINFPRH